MDHTNKNDLIKLAKALSFEYVDDKAMALAKLHFAGLMDVEIPWYLNFLLNRAYKKHGYDAATNRLYNILMTSSKDDVDTYYMEFLHHIVHGTDESDSKSAGGFNIIQLLMIESIFNLNEK